MEFGYLRQDQSCHWYLVPEKFIEGFDRMTVNDLEDVDDVNEFENRYERFRLGAGYQDIRCVIENGHCVR